MVTSPILPANRAKPAFLRYGGAVLLMGLMLLARIALAPFSDESPYLALFIGVVLSAWYGGLGPGILTTVVSSVVVVVFVVTLPRLGSAAELTRLVIFVGQGVLVSYL